MCSLSEVGDVTQMAFRKWWRENGGVHRLVVVSRVSITWSIGWWRFHSFNEWGGLLRRLKIERFRCCIETARHAVAVTHLLFLCFQSSLILMSIQVRGTALGVCVSVCVCADSRAPSFFLSLHVLLVKDIHLISGDRFHVEIQARWRYIMREPSSVRLLASGDRAPGGKGRNLISVRRNCLEGKCPHSHTQHRNDKKKRRVTHTLTQPTLVVNFLLYLFQLQKKWGYRSEHGLRKRIKVRKGKILS